MEALAPLKLYLCANVLLVLATALLEGIRVASARLRHPMAYRHQLRLGQTAALAALLLPLVSASSGRSAFLPQTAQVWSAATLHDGALAASTDQRVLVSLGSSAASVPLDIAGRAMCAMFGAGLLFVLLRLAMDASATLSIIADAQAIRRHRSVRILASERICVPFSFWLPAHHYVIVPSTLVIHAEALRLAIRHEIQHHRQQDTKLVYMHQLLKAAFFWNPAVHRLERQIRELEELACDEALGGQRGISTRSYCQCLLQVAEAATRQRGSRLHASMIGRGTGKLLRQRIEALLMRPKLHLKRSFVFGAGAVALALMATTAFSFASTIHDRRISAADANRLAAVAKRGSTFPIVVNDSVVKQLNLLLSTPDGRADLQAGLSRMREHQAFISGRLVQHGMPLELLAVPLVESGYRNQPQGADPRHGAGLWMFVGPTARRFGLTVDASRDDRLDVARETDAAMRLLSSLHQQFGDWGLALLAFNAGSKRVERAIVETGSRDVWTLLRHGHENDAGYVPRMMAAVLILANPSVLD